MVSGWLIQLLLDFLYAVALIPGPSSTQLREEQCIKMSVRIFSWNSRRCPKSHEKHKRQDGDFYLEPAV